MIPPCVKAAKRHAIATGVGLPNDAIDGEKKYFEEDEFRNICPCCGKSMNIKPISICTSNSNMKFMGVGVTMYFDFDYLVSGTMILSFLVLGVYLCVRNYYGDRCQQFEDVEDSEYLCSDYLVSLLSSANYNTKIVDRTEKILGAALIIVCAVFRLIYFAIMKRRIGSLRNQRITPKLYTVMATNIPKDATLSEIEAFFTDSKRLGKEVKIAQITPCYNIGNYIKLLRTKAKLSIKLKIEIRKKSGNNVLGKLQSKLEKVEKKLIPISEEFSIAKNSKKFIGIVFITFEKMGDKDTVLSHLQTNPLKYFFYRTIGMKCLFGAAAPTFKGRVINVRQPYEPHDIIWEHLGHSLGWRIKNYIYIMVVVVLLFLCSFCLIFACKLYVYFYVRTREEGREFQYPKRLVSTTITIIVLTNNVVLAFAMRKLTLSQHPSTFSHFGINYTQRSFIAQFINSGLVMVIANYIVSGNSLADQMWGEESLGNEVLNLLIINGLTIPFQKIFDFL